MTTKQIVEQLLEVFPKYTETLVRMDVNRVYKDFCYKTRLLRKSANLTLSTAVKYSLPSDFQELVWVKAYDASSNELDILTYDIEGGYIYFYDVYGDKMTTFPTAITTITLYYIYIPTDLSLTDTPAIPTMFHEALVEGVMEKYYRREGILQQHGASKQYYKEAVIEGKKHANIDGDKSINIIQQYL